MARGTVKWFNAQKGYGFIEQADGGKDVFVHVNSLAIGVGTLAEGQTVEFEVETTGTSEAASLRASSDAGARRPETQARPVPERRRRRRPRTT